MRKSHLCQPKQQRFISTCYFHRLRQHFYQAVEEETLFSGEIEVDESHFGGRRKGKRGRGVAGKVPVFGILKRGGNVHTNVIPDVRSTTLMRTMEQKIVPISIVYADSHKAITCLMSITFTMFG